MAHWHWSSTEEPSTSRVSSRSVSSSQYAIIRSGWRCGRASKSLPIPPCGEMLVRCPRVRRPFWIPTLQTSQILTCAYSICKSEPVCVIDSASASDKACAEREHESHRPRPSLYYIVLFHVDASMALCGTLIDEYLTVFLGTHRLLLLHRRHLLHRRSKGLLILGSLRPPHAIPVRSTPTSQYLLRLHNSKHALLNGRCLCRLHGNQSPYHQHRALIHRSQPWAFMALPVMYIPPSI